MKIQIEINPELKTNIIRVEGTVKMSELIRSLDELLPGGVWKDFDLETQAVVNWQQFPVYPLVCPPYPVNPLPQNQPWCVWKLEDNLVIKHSLVPGTFNVEA